MQGHTNKKTINARRPLTENMLDMMRKLAEWGRVKHSSMSQSQANAIKALCTRGYATFHIEDRSYSLRNAGREALELSSQDGGTA